MITGIGIASQQVNEHSRILILRANLAFVRTKALLATVMVLRMRLRNFSLLYNWFNEHTHKIGGAVRLKNLKMRYCRPLGGIA